MSVPLKLSALLLAIAAVALPASAAARDHDRGNRGHDRHDRHGQYDRHRGDRRQALRFDNRMAAAATMTIAPGCPMT